MIIYIEKSEIIIWNIIKGDVCVYLIDFEEE